jgi:hypothetical protein
MATMYGHQVYEWLLERGWEAAPPPKEFVCGDPHVNNPDTKEPMNVYLAAKLHREKTGEYPDFIPKDW